METILTNPKFSVVVPLYNCEKYIKQCIESIINQTYDNLELIIVNDGSTDNGLEICKDFATIDKRIKIIDKNCEGVVKARQVGVSQATGEFLIFIDSDDFIDKDYLSAFNDITEKHTLDVVCMGSVWVYDDKDVLEKTNIPTGYYDRKRIETEIFPFLIEDENGKHFSATLWAKAFRKELYVKTQLKDVVVDMGEDGACVYPCVFNANSLYVLNDIKYFYRQREGSATNNKHPFSLEGPKLISLHLEEHIAKNDPNFTAQIYRKTVHNLFNAVLSQFNKDASFKQIKISILDCLKDEYYKNSIKKCKYRLKNYKGYFAKVLLKHKAIRLIKILKK